MDSRQKLLLRNIIGGVGLLILLAFVLAYCGVFEGGKSDEAQIRELMENLKVELSDHDWDDALRLCDLEPDERDAWKEAIPRQAELVKIVAITPDGFISVPPGASEFQLEVTVLARLEAPIAGNLRADTTKGTLHFVRRNGMWLIDLDRSAPTFPYLPAPPTKK